ncbi:MAG: Do family serine endopeptidase [Burkholderiales bacterium]|nr:Do family serine endopeptidase [Burkholderiales bacterium]MDE1926738.1 Do family serine endopeptidase [Burkholderiales bacterium]MDE2158763.1 Do family serine endopeptidase [Burkholderiales bacterium]MDE2503984.1 Do family serine endopeptidase [Burkholderiales bacterium]
MKRTTLATASAFIAAGLAAASAQAWNLPSWIHGASNAQNRAGTADTVSSAPISATPLPAGTLPNYRAIVQTEGPAVVGVLVSGMHNTANDAEDGHTQQMTPFNGQDPFFRFFQGIPGFTMPPQGEVPFRGQGSGFIISSDGLILTNAHVVREAKHVQVKLADRREFNAKVLGSDTASDIAVIKIDAHNLPVVTLGDNRTAQVGDWVLAIGAPYGFDETATQGIVSAKGRSLGGDSYVPFIQTDAAVNPGNSGGPLFDAEGRVIGINAQIYTHSGGFQGLAFAIPIDVALKVKDQIVAHGHVDHARLGVMVQDLTSPLAKSFGLKSPDGAVISTITPGSAAAGADLKPGDVITAIDGKPVHTAGDVSAFVGMATPGERLKLQVWRNGASRDIGVALGAANPGASTHMARTEPGSLGLQVRPLQRDELKQAGIDHGLLIEGVAGPAAEAGIQPGDVLLALNGKPVSTVQQVHRALESHPHNVALLIDRNGQQIFVPVDLG